MSGAAPLLPLVARALPSLAWLMAGVVFGMAYFALLRISVRSLITPHKGGIVAVLAVARIAASVALFASAAHWGAAALLAAFGGFLLARTGQLRAARR